MDVADGEATLPLSLALFVDPGTLVPLAEQTGFIGLPFAAAQQAVDALPAGAVVLLSIGAAGPVTTSREISFRGLGVAGGADESMARLGSVVAAAAVRFESLVVDEVFADGSAVLRGCNVGTVTAAGGSVLMQDCSCGDVDVDHNLRLESTVLAGDSVVVGDSLEAFDSRVLATSISLPAGSLFARDTEFSGDLVASVADLQDCSLTVLTAGFADLDGCAIGAGGLAVTGLTLRNCTCAGAIATAGGGATIEDCSLQSSVAAAGDLTLLRSRVLGNVSVTGTLTIDLETYQSILNGGHTVTAGTAISIVDLPAVVRVNGYTAGAILNMIVLAAGHLPGFYLISLAVVVRAAATAGSVTRSYAFTSAGALAIGGFGAAAITSVGPPNASFTSISVYSDGVGPIRVLLTPAGVTGAPSLDVSAQAELIGV